MRGFRWDQFRVDPTITLDVAWRVVERLCEHPIRYDNFGNPLVPESLRRRSVTFDVYCDDGEIVQCAHVPAERAAELPSLSEQHNRLKRRRSRDDAWSGRDAELYGEPPFPERRVEIIFGRIPYITLRVDFAENVTHTETNSYFDSVERQFVPEAYPGDEPVHCVVTREMLEEWFYEFVPSDPLTIKSRDDIEFVAGDGGIDRLKERVTRYFFEQLPAPDDDGVTADCVFEPAYIGGMLHVRHWTAREICNELTGDDGPLTKVHPPGEDMYFNFDEYACAHPAYWGDVNEYDWSTHLYRAASREPGGRLSIV